MKNTVAMYGGESDILAQTIAHKLGISMLGVKKKKFADGERYLRIETESNTDLMGKNVVYVCSTVDDQAIEDLYRIGCSLSVGEGTRRRVFVIPYFGYSTMERKVKPGEVVTAKTIARKFSAIPNAGNNSFLFMDLHVSGLVHYFEGDCLRAELKAWPLILAGIEGLGLKNPVIATADLGRSKYVEDLAGHFKTDIAFVAKSRDFEDTKILAVIGDVEGKDVVIYDDMTRSGGSLVKAAHAYKARGANRVFGVLSHLALNNLDVIEVLQNSPFERIIATDTHPLAMEHEVIQNDFFQILPVADIFVPVIKAILR